MRIKKALLYFLIFLLTFFFLETEAYAEVYTTFPSPTPGLEYNLPYPGILPDHPLYPLKLLRDKILYYFTRDPLKKIQLKVLFSDKKAAMGQLLWEKGREDLAISTFIEGEKDLLQSSTSLKNLKSLNNLPPGTADKIELAAKKHEGIMVGIYSFTDDDLKKAELAKAIEINHQATQYTKLYK